MPLHNHDRIILLYIEWIWTNYCKLSRNFVRAIRTTTINCRVSFIELYFVFPRNFRMVFLPHTNTVILLEPYCGTMTEPGLPVVTLGQDRQKTYIILNGNFICLSCPSATFALQYGLFVPRQRLAAKGLFCIIYRFSQG